MPHFTIDSGSSTYSSQIKKSTLSGRVHYTIPSYGFRTEGDEVIFYAYPKAHLQIQSSKKRTAYYYKVGVKTGAYIYDLVPGDLFAGVASSSSSSVATTSWKTLGSPYTFNVYELSFPLNYDEETERTISIPQLTAYFNYTTTQSASTFNSHTITLKFSAAKIIVSCNKNNPEDIAASDITIPSTKYIAKGGTVESIADAVDKTDTYDFVGWRKDSPTGPLMTFPYTLGSTDDITLYASWRKATKSELSAKSDDTWKEANANAKASNGEWVTADRVYVRKKDVWL